MKRCMYIHSDLFSDGYALSHLKGLMQVSSKNCSPKMYLNNTVFQTLLPFMVQHDLPQLFAALEFVAKYSLPPSTSVSGPWEQVAPSHSCSPQTWCIIPNHLSLKGGHNTYFIRCHNIKLNTLTCHKMLIRAT